MNEELVGFGVVLDALEEGKRATCTRWNGKGMFIFLVNGSEFEVNRPPLLGIFPEGTKIKYKAHIDIKTATGEIVPWAASQGDLLGKDWVILD